MGNFVSKEPKLKENTVEYWTKEADGYDKVVSKKEDNQWRTQTRNFINKYIAEHFAEKENLSVLDYGCGSGALTLDLIKHKQIKEVVAIDITQKLIDIMGTNLNNCNENEQSKVTAICGDVKDLQENYKDNHFDLIVSGSVLTFVEDFDKAVNDLTKLLNKESGLHIHFCYKKGRFSPKNEEGNYLQGFTSSKELADAFSRNNLEVINHGIGVNYVVIKYIFGFSWYVVVAKPIV